MLDSYLSKVIVMFIGAGAGISAIAGGFYTLFLVLTYVGN